MSFAGDLEHLPIVDVIQLLHSTRKTGTLYLSSEIGESQLVFVDGFIVSANHVDNSIRIGQILVDMGAITPDHLENSLAVQKKAGVNRKPLIATLIEGKQIKEEEAYKGLETLIEMSIVEILTWTKGSFKLDVSKTTASDEYRYFPETLKQDINLNTQNVLMDALRIYDERMRSGTLENGVFSTPEQAPENAFSAEIKESGITADLLGLDEIDTLAKKIPDVYSGLRDYEFSGLQAPNIRPSQPDQQQAEQDKIFSYLMESDDLRSTDKKRQPATQQHNEIVLCSKDPFINRIIMTTCKYEGLLFTGCEDLDNLVQLLDYSSAKASKRLLIFDAPDESTERDAIQMLLQLREKNQQMIPIVQLYGCQNGDFNLRALFAGADVTVPRPPSDNQQIVFTEQTVIFLKALQKIIQSNLLNRSESIAGHFKDCMADLAGLRDEPKLAYVPLKFASQMFERSITFFVSETELIAKNNIGISKNMANGSSQPISVRIPINQHSIFSDVVQKGVYYFGECEDILLINHLFSEIDKPVNNSCVLMPITSLGKVVAVIYADFGSGPAKQVSIDLLDTVAKTTGMALDNCFYRKQLVKQKK